MLEVYCVNTLPIGENVIIPSAGNIYANTSVIGLCLILYLCPYSVFSNNFRVKLNKQKHSIFQRNRKEIAFTPTNWYIRSEIINKL